MLIVERFPYIFVVGFDKQFFRGMKVVAASGNGILQLLILTVRTIVPTGYQLYLTCVKDENLNM